MLIEKYLERQLHNLPDPFAGIFRDVRSLRQLAEMRQLVCTTSALFQSGKLILTQYFAIQDQTLDTKQEILQIAGSLATASQLPLHQAVATATKEEGLLLREIETETGPHSVTGHLDRTWYILGDEQAMQEEDINLGVTSQTLANQLESEGKQVLFLAQRQPKRLLGIFGCATPLYPEAVEVVEELQDLGIELVLLSEQKNRVATGLARSLGIDHVQGELNRECKQQAIEQYVADKPVGFLCTIGTLDLIPEDELAILWGKRLSPQVGVLVQELTELPQQIRVARSLLNSAKKRFFWCKLEKI